MATATAEPRDVVVELPTSEHYKRDILEPLSIARNHIECLQMELANVMGEIDPVQWKARLSHRPTMAEIGALSVFVDFAESDVECIAEYLATLRGVLGRLGLMERQGEVRLNEKREEV